MVATEKKLPKLSLFAHVVPHLSPGPRKRFDLNNAKKVTRLDLSDLSLTGKCLHTGQPTENQQYALYRD